jgi:hypothetical protein
VDQDYFSIRLTDIPRWTGLGSLVRIRYSCISRLTSYSSFQSFRFLSERRYVSLIIVSWRIFYSRYDQVYVNEVVFGTAFGVLMGPLCAGIFNPQAWTTDTNKVTLEIMRLDLARGLFAIGVELPGSYMYQHMRGLLVMIVPTMAIGWVIVAS